MKNNLVLSVAKYTSAAAAVAFVITIKNRQVSALGLHLWQLVLRFLTSPVLLFDLQPLFNMFLFCNAVK